MTLEAGRMGAREGQRLLEGEEAASSRAAGASALDAVHRQTVQKTIPPGHDHRADPEMRAWLFREERRMGGGVPLTGTDILLII